MELPDIPQDDLIDVMEMTNKIEEYVYHVLKDNETSLALSALMSACINCTLDQCSTLDEVLFYRNLFVQILDSSIRNIKIQGAE
jgi:hypothetical protein